MPLSRLRTCSRDDQTHTFQPGQPTNLNTYARQWLSTTDFCLERLQDNALPGQSHKTCKPATVPLPTVSPASNLNHMKSHQINSNNFPESHHPVIYWSRIVSSGARDRLVVGRGQMRLYVYVTNWFAQCSRWAKSYLRPCRLSAPKNLRYHCSREGDTPLSLLGAWG